MTDERRAELLAAVTIVAESNEVFQEFENANYHSAWEFLDELRRELKRGEDIGWDEEEDEDDEDFDLP